MGKQLTSTGLPSMYTLNLFPSACDVLKPIRLKESGKLSDRKVGEDLLTPGLVLREERGLHCGNGQVVASLRGCHSLFKSLSNHVSGGRVFECTTNRDPHLL